MSLDSKFVVIMTSNVNQRKGHRAFATKTIGEVVTALAAETPDEDQVRVLQKTLLEKLETLNLLDGEILDTLTEEDAINAEIDKSSYVRQQIQKSLLTADSFIKKK